MINEPFFELTTSSLALFRPCLFDYRQKEFFYVNLKKIPN